MAVIGRSGRSKVHPDPSLSKTSRVLRLSFHPMNHAKHLYTIGYAGQTLEGFLRRLKQVGVLTVVDVRELPLSRKSGFSKRALAVQFDERSEERLGGNRRVSTCNLPGEQAQY